MKVVKSNILFDVLIVENTLSMALNCQNSLRKTNIRSQICQTGEDTLAVLRTGNALTVILDPNLPDMDGLDIIREMNETTHDVKFIVITANGSVKTAVDAMRMGAFDFLIKPFTFESLTVSVKNAIDIAKLNNVRRTTRSNVELIKFRGLLASLRQC